jgi:ribosomal-protein-alanine N-acetyltransferase
MDRVPTPRPLAEADLDRVAELERRIFPDPWSRGAFEEALGLGATGAFAVDDESGQVVGYGVCRLLADQGEILNLAVSPERRGQGLGSALLSAMLDWLRRCGAVEVFLEVRSSNREAIAVYQRFGFLERGLRKAYYRHPLEDALSMGLDLAGWSARK